MLFERRIHPYSMKSPLRDAFQAAEASLFGEISAGGCFSSGGCIPIRRNFRWGMLFERRKHLYSKKFSLRDVFPEEKASLKGTKAL